MKIICRNNCSGKTKELIRESLDTQTPILVFSDSKRRSLEDKSLAYFNELVETIDVLEAKNYNGKVLIDDLEENLDSLLKHAFNNPMLSVGAMTLSA